LPSGSGTVYRQHSEAWRISGSYQST
jgi:hypothetical protein